MTVIANENSRLSWLLGRLANRRNHIVHLVRRLTGFGHPGALKPSLFAKFLHMMDDVAAASKEEAVLIGHIDRIEQRHLVMRQCRKLRQATPKRCLAALPANEDEPQEAEEASGSGRLFKLLVLWHLLTR